MITHRKNEVADQVLTGAQARAMAQARWQVRSRQGVRPFFHKKITKLLSAGVGAVYRAFT